MPRRTKKKIALPRSTRSRRQRRRTRQSTKTSAENLQSSLNSPEMQEKVSHMFGKVTTVTPSVVERKRHSIMCFMKPMASYMHKILKAASDTYDDLEPPESLRQTIEWAEFTKDEARSVFISLHPHEWLTHSTLTALYNLKKCLIEVNKASNTSIARRDIESFRLWSNDTKVLLPSIGAEYNFAEVSEVLDSVFPLLVRLDLAASAIIKEIVHPPYDWEIAFDLRMQKIIREMPGHLSKAFLKSRDTFICQLPSVYMRALGVTDTGIDWSIVADRLMSVELNEAKIVEEACSVIDGSRDPRLRQIVNEWFDERHLNTITDAVKRGVGHATPVATTATTITEDDPVAPTIVEETTPEALAAAIAVAEVAEPASVPSTV